MPNYLVGIIGDRPRFFAMTNGSFIAYYKGKTPGFAGETVAV